MNEKQHQRKFNSNFGIAVYTYNAASSKHDYAVFFLFHFK